MLLGVPTLNRYDLLNRLIVSAEAGRLKPSDYFIVDNGRRFGDEATTMPGVATAMTRGARFFVLTPDENLGVAASWNALLDAAGAVPMAISNDDVELGEGVLEEIDRALVEHDFVHAGGWCLFAQTPECTARVGSYDERFSPAYYEDSDYEHRLSLARVPVHVVAQDLKHEGWATASADPSGTVLSSAAESAKTFHEKWGGMPTEPEKLTRYPQVKAIRRAYSANISRWRRYLPEVPKTMRWDVINHIGFWIGANRYLEIGVSSGENMRQVEIPSKTGVDPNPTIEGVSAADVFCPKSSDSFFGGPDLAERWDIAFVDGLHHADQAYRDIINAARVARVVVVHDANPSTEAMQRVPYEGGEWTGDVWKAIARIRSEGKHLVRTIDTDYGVAVVLPNRADCIVYGVNSDDNPRAPPRALPRETWDDLQMYRKELLGLIPVPEWKAWFEEAIR